MRPRSFCPNCQKTIRWYENIPVLSYLFQRGACSGCKASISARYPIVELMVAVLFAACAHHRGLDWLLFARDWPLMVILIAITFIDLDHRIIPDELNLAGLIIGLGTAYWDPDLGWVMSLTGFGVGFLGFFLLGTVYEKVTGKEGLGGGDVKYLAMIGSFIGPMGIFTTVLVSSVLGSIFGLSYGWIERRKYKVQHPDQSSPGLMQVAIPYGPFLVIGSLYYYFFRNIPGLSLP